MEQLRGKEGQVEVATITEELQGKEDQVEIATAMEQLNRTRLR
jgi:hypothetical protein